jgi:hypothetical protein
MSSPLCYGLARQQQAELARRAERVRQTIADGSLVPEPRRRRLAGVLGPRRRRLAGVLGLIRPDQRELALPPRGDERIPVAAGCLEVE